MISFIRITFMTMYTIFAISSAIVYRLFSGSPKTPVWWAHSWWAPGTLWLAGVKLEVEGLEQIDFSKPYVFVSNHQSFIDIPCVVKALPTRLHFVGKKELKKFPFIGQYMVAMGMIFIDRSNVNRAIESLKQAGKLVKNGKSVIAFPEGTRTKDGSVGPFKKGTFLLAAEAGVQIVPIRIEGARKVWPAERVYISPGKIRVSIGKPIDTMGVDKQNVADFCKSVQATIEKL